MACFSLLPGSTSAVVWIRSRIATVVPFALGTILLIAAALKAEQLTTGPVPENNLFTSRWFQIGLIELELGAGLCLLLGLGPRLVRWLALACFSTFGAVSFYQALTGKPSCGCFGAVELRPWFTFLLDTSAVAALWHWRPYRSVCTDRGGQRRVAGPIRGARSLLD